MIARRLLLTLPLLSLACGSESSPPPAEAGATCGSANCGGCCQGTTCLGGTVASACGSSGLPCILCENSTVCAHGQCLPTSPTCNTTTCPAGCCQGDVCVDGTTLDACGKGGLPCAKCGSTQTCEDRACGCSTTSCVGCCENGVCRPGGESSACGSGGVACVTCDSALSCIAGKCQSVCSTANCSGCCDGSTCRSGMDLATCGAGGKPCAKCPTNDTCAGGVCKNSSCGPSSCTGCCFANLCNSGTSALCGKGGASCELCSLYQTCSQQACVFDLTQQLFVTAYSAEIDPAKKWDTPFYTAPDPYVECSAASTSKSTTVLADTYSPVWDQICLITTAGELTKNGLMVKIYDSDTLGSELIDSCLIVIPESVVMSHGGTVTSCGKTGDIKKFVFKIY
jgi:hypothetical protein